jgi:hypothetical protein
MNTNIKLTSAIFFFFFIPFFFRSYLFISTSVCVLPQVEARGSPGKMTLEKRRNDFFHGDTQPRKCSIPQRGKNLSY